VDKEENEAPRFSGAFLLKNIFLSAPSALELRFKNELPCVIVGLRPTILNH
jgi:hypothetical protein